MKDDKVEIVFSFSVTENEVTYHESRVINEDGTDLLVLPDASYIKFKELAGADPKLVAYYRLENNTNTTEVYGLPASAAQAGGVPAGGPSISGFLNPATDILKTLQNDQQIYYENNTHRHSDGKLFFARINGWPQRIRRPYTRKRDGPGRDHC